MTRHSFFTTRLASASLLFAMLAGAICASASVANARGLVPRALLPHGLIPHGNQSDNEPTQGMHTGAAQEWLSKYYLPLPAPGGPNGVYPDASAAAYADKVFNEVNAERTQKGFAPLTRNAHLDAVAQAHGVHMVQAKFFEHESPLGMQAAERIAAAGGPDWSWVGENIAAGYQTPEIAVDNWMRSKGHRRNILNGQFVETGIGVLYDPRSFYGWYWVQVFATFDSHGQQTQWVETRGAAPAGANQLAQSSPGQPAVKVLSNPAGAELASEQQQTGDDQDSDAGNAQPEDTNAGHGGDATPDWTPAHPAPPQSGS